MLSRLFKKNEKPAAKASFEKLNKNELKNVIGGSGSDTTTAPVPVETAIVKSKSNISNN